MKIVPDFSAFKALARKGNLIPVYAEIIADTDTPVSAFMKIAQNSPTSFLFESVEGGERSARYSFLCGHASHTAACTFNSARIANERTKKQTFKETPYPLGELRAFLRQYKPVRVPGLPRFYGGAVGYMCYDTVRYYEDLPMRKKERLWETFAQFMITDTLLIFDHVQHKIIVVANVFADGNLKEKYEDAVTKIKKRVQELKRPVPMLSRARKKLSQKDTELQSNFSKREYMHVVEKAKEYIRAGDIFQMVPSQRFSRKVNIHPFMVYRALRAINPSPYLFYLRFHDLHIIGSSPELLVRLEDGLVETRPIAGTRHRGKTAEEDERLKKELLADEKEKAEHLMLVDLGRNDLGRVCETGSVNVTDFMIVEKYSHVMHIVSHVAGKIKKGKDGFDVLRACFPAGTVSGAPKIRAMEIIEELEPAQRGPYAGAVGYFGFSGNMDTAITIRTIVIKGNTAYVQAGGGVVADSVPEREYAETMNKAKAMFKALEIAEKEF